VNEVARHETVEAGRLLFAGLCEFMAAAGSPESLPAIGTMEIAFCGRSNVGKSSLVNALTGRKALARTSHTPGRTQELNFFAIGAPPPHEKLRLVDMPGYGYAAVSKAKSEDWTKLIRAYLRGRPTLARVFVLVDGRHGLKASDLELCDLLDTAAVSYQIVLTKADEVRQVDQDARRNGVAEAIVRRAAAHPQILFTSARTGAEIADLRAEIVELLERRR
jgi:GTP-binding protein